MNKAFHLTIGAVLAFGCTAALYLPFHPETPRYVAGIANVCLAVGAAFGVWKIMSTR